MKSGVPSIILISDDQAITDAVGSALKVSDGITLEMHKGNLSSVNGAAAAMAEAHDLMVFRLNPETDFAIVAELRDKVGDSARLLALSDDGISLADAIAMKRAGIDEVLPFPIQSADLREQLVRMSLRDIHLPAIHEQDRMGQVIAVCPVRGGIGATTFSVNLANHLQGKTGMIHKTAAHRVALVDLDLQFGAVASALDLDASDTLYRLATDAIMPDRTFLAQSMVEHVSGLSVLTAPDRFAPMEALGRAQVDALIGHLQADYDYVVLDLPRTLVEWVEPVVARAARIMMVTDTTVPAIRQARRMIDFFSDTRFDLPVEIVVNQEKKPMISSSHHVEAAKVLERPLKYWLPKDPRHTRTALDRGQVLAQASGGSSLDHAIRKIARNILKEAGTAKQAHS